PFLMYRINDNKIKHSPRALKFWECCLAVFYENLSSFKNGQTTTEQETVVNINELIEDKDHSSIYLDKAYDYYLRANKYHWSSYEVEDKEEYKKKLFQRKVRPFKGKNK